MQRNLRSVARAAGPRLVALGLGMLAGSGDSLGAGRAAWAQTVPTGMHAPEVEARLDNAFLNGLDAVYRGRPSEADRIAEEMLRLAPGDPRPHLFKARVLRLDVPDQSSARDRVKPYAKPILEVVDRAIEACDAMLLRDPSSIAGHLYRGWAFMFKAQIHALAGEYWSAGQRAKAGKKDLDFVLERDPGNADALLIQGVYLYFADVLPATVKLARFFIGVPGGHRVRGLEYIEAAGLRHGYLRLDAKAILGVVLFGFEGRFADATAKLESVDAEYPGNARMLEPRALMDLFFPERLGAALARTREAVSRHSGSDEPWERKVAARLRFYLVLQQMVAGRLDSARANLEQLQRGGPEDPDWLEERVLKTLVDVELMLGEQERAAQRVEALPPEHRLRQKLRYAREPVPPQESQALVDLQPALRELYDGGLDTASQAIASLGEMRAPFVAFYRGELDYLRGRYAEALRHFESVTDKDTPERWEWFQNFAYLRAAEIHGLMGHDARAEQILDEFVGQYPTRDLLRHVAKARKRYFENGKPGSQAMARTAGTDGKAAVESR